MKYILPPAQLAMDVDGRSYVYTEHEMQAAYQAGRDSVAYTGELPELPHHPEPRTMRWSDLEVEAIQDYARQAIAGALAKAEASYRAELDKVSERNYQLRMELAKVGQSEAGSTCNDALRLQGKPYPRTCKKCGLGPCIGKPAPAAQPETLTGCACRWDADDNRVVTCVRHQGWLDVVHEWAERAKAAEAKAAEAKAAQPLELSSFEAGWRAAW